MSILWRGSFSTPVWKCWGRILSPIKSTSAAPCWRLVWIINGPFRCWFRISRRISCRRIFCSCTKRASRFCRLVSIHWLSWLIVQSIDWVIDWSVSSLFCFRGKTTRRWFNFSLRSTSHGTFLILPWMLVFEWSFFLPWLTGSANWAVHHHFRTLHCLRPTRTTFAVFSSSDFRYTSWMSWNVCSIWRAKIFYRLMVRDIWKNKLTKWTFEHKNILMFFYFLECFENLTFFRLFFCIYKMSFLTIK